MSNKPDASGLTKQERHDIIINYLKSINKPTKVFHLRWRPGDLLNGKILRSTPMFWYMKYEFSRAQIEEMFYKSRIAIDPLFDSSLQQVFGGQPGPRWNSNKQPLTSKKWKQRHTQNVIKWKASKAINLKDKPLPSNPINNNTNNDNEKKSDIASSMKTKLTQEIGKFSNEIWLAVSDFGADKSITYQVFTDNLKDRGVNVSPFLAKQLFDQLAKPSGTISKQGMEVLIKQLDQMVIPQDFINITWEDMATKLGAQMVMKRVLLAAGIGEPLNVDDFIYDSKMNVKISPIQYMNKLSDRDVPWSDRSTTMEQLGINLGVNPLFNNLLVRGNIPQLLCGWATQILDTKPEVQKTAINTLPKVFNTCMTLGQDAPEIAVNHLEELLSNLFTVLDDPNNSKNDQLIKDTISKIVDDVINLNDNESILFLAGILSEKCDLENIQTVPARLFAVEQLKKIMFDKDDKIPKPGSLRREWLDIAANIQSSPIPTKNVINKYKRRGPPFAVLESYPKETFPDEPIDFDASKSRDHEDKPCIEFTFDFGDGTIKTQKEPLIKHKYDKIGQYDVTLTVKDNTNQTAKAMVIQRVINKKKTENSVVDEDGDNGVDDVQTGKNEPNGDINRVGQDEKTRMKGNKLDVTIGFGKDDNNDPASNGAMDDEEKYDKDGSDGDVDVDGLGKEFRIVISDAVGMIIEDPNVYISKEGKRLVDVMKQLSPKWDELLPGSARKKYREWEFPMKPYNTDKEPDKDIEFNAGDAEVHKVRTDVALDVKFKGLPDI